MSSFVVVGYRGRGNETGSPDHFAFHLTHAPFFWSVKVSESAKRLVTFTLKNGSSNE
jgi:hypothetical protein